MQSIESPLLPREHSADETEYRVSDCSTFCLKSLNRLMRRVCHDRRPIGQWFLSTSRII